MNMKCVLALSVAVCYVTIVHASSAQHGFRVKRGFFDDVLDDLTNFGNNLADKISVVVGKIKDFTEENFEKFKESLKSLSKENLQNTLESLTSYYNSLGDKSSVEAQRVRATMDQIKSDLGISGSAPVQSTLLGSLALVFLALRIMG